MKTLKNLIPLVVLALLGLTVSMGLEAGFSASPYGTETQKQAEVAHLSPGEAHDFILKNHANSHLIILDVRTPAEFAEGHLANAVNIDFHGNNFRQDIAELDRQKAYLIYCRTGRRSDRTLAMMKDMGFTRAYNMLGGITQWQQEGFDIVI